MSAGRVAACREGAERTRRGGARAAADRRRQSRAPWLIEREYNGVRAGVSGKKKKNGTPSESEFRFFD